MLARALVQAGHAVRGTTRDPARLPGIEAAGAEALVADPDRVATIAPALDHVTVVCVLLGSAAGDPSRLEALHGSRLEMLLTRLVDTTMHGLVYEARGSAPPDLLEHGTDLVAGFAARTHARCELLRADPADPAAWLRAAVASVDAVLGPARSPADSYLRRGQTAR